MSRREEVMKSFLQYEEETERRVSLGVEMYRKGYGYLQVRDGEGKPAAGVRIRAKLRNHAFLHGANLFMLEEFDTEEKNAKYREAFADCFNEATVPIYWNKLEPEEGKPRFDKDSPKIYRRPALDLCLEYCRERGITPKAHCLTYVNFDPDWVDETDLSAVRRAYDKRYRELSERYADLIPGWEVINETLCGFPELIERCPYFASDRFVEENFALAQKYFPYNELIINEASQIWEPRIRFSFNRSDYYQLVERSLKNGARIDAVGLQFHAFVRAEEEKSLTGSLYNPRQIYRVLDQYAKLGRPLQITEITIPAYFDTEEDYELQAEILRRLYRIWFSHPSVEAAIYWNLPDGYAGFAPIGDMTKGENYYRGGLLDFRLDPKPAYRALVDLFQKEWTTDVTVETDRDGRAKFLGFYGEYELTIGDEHQTMKLIPDRIAPKELLWKNV